MKAYTKQERQGDIVQLVLTCAVYAVVLALNDLYGWRIAAEKVAAAVAEILNGYAAEAGGTNEPMLDRLIAEVRERGFDKFAVEMRKGGKH